MYNIFYNWPILSILQATMADRVAYEEFRIDWLMYYTFDHTLHLETIIQLIVIVTLSLKLYLACLE